MVTGVRAALMLVVGLALCACGGGLDIGFGVATTIIFDSSVDNASLASVTALALSVTGDETFTGSAKLPTAATRTERFIYRPMHASHAIIITVTAVDAEGNVIAVGQSGVVSLVSGGAVSTDIELHAGATLSNDGGVPFDSTTENVDFAGRDLTGVDLAHSAPADLSTFDASGGASKCPGLSADESVLACLGFETATDIHQTLAVDATLSIDNTKHFRGASSLHINTTAGPDNATGITSNGFSLPPELHARLFVYRGSAAVPGQTQLVAGIGGYSSLGFYLGLNTNGALETGLPVAPTDGGATSKISATKLPDNEWSCLELVVTISGKSDGALSVFMNEAHVTDLDLKGPTVSSLGLDAVGLMLDFDSAGPFDIWMDEVIFATKQIGCEK